MYQSDEGVSASRTAKAGWSASNLMVSGDRSKQVSLQANFDVKGTYVASFELKVLDDISGSGLSPIQAEATLEWAVSGNTVVRKVTVRNGTSIQGVGEGVRITIKDVTVGTGAAVGIRYAMTVVVAYGDRGSFETPPILVPLPVSSGTVLVTLLAGTAKTLDIPQDVGVKTILVTVADPNAVPVAITEQKARVTQLNSGVAVCMYDPRAFTWAPLYPGSNQVELKNLTGVTLSFQVFYGIDG